MTIAKINNIAIANIAKINKKVSKDYVKLLIQFDGADGANTYTAETGQTVTFAGTAQLDTAIKKYGTASLLLPGSSGDYLSVPDSDDFYILDGSDFTIEMWLYYHSSDRILSQGTFNGNGGTWAIYCNSSGRLRFFARQAAGQVVNIGVDSGGVVVDTWIHVAVVRYGNVWTIYKNGTNIGSTTSTQAFSNIAADLWIGRESAFYLNGHIDDLRIVKGYAVYTTDFTPPENELITGLIDIAKVNNIAI